MEDKGVIVSKEGFEKLEKELDSKLQEIIKLIGDMK